MDPSLWGGAPLGAADERGVWSDAALLVSATHAKRWKDDLDRRGWLDRARRPASFPEDVERARPAAVAFPVRDALAPRVRDAAADDPGVFAACRVRLPAVAAPTDRRAATAAAASPSTPPGPSTPLPPPPPVPRDAPALFPTPPPEPGTVARVPCPPDRDAFAELTATTTASSSSSSSSSRAPASAPEPLVLLDVPMGDAPTLWTPEFLAACPEADELVDVHVCPPTRAGGSDASPSYDAPPLAATVDLAGHRAPGTRRNFEFRKMPFGELVRRVSSEGPGQDCAADEGAFAPVIAPGEKYYLRSVAKRPTKTPAHLPAEFPSLAATLAKGGAILPGGPRALFDERSYHSTVLRVASEGTALWTHYDTHDNLLAQVVGRKTVTLWPPEAAPFLYVQGSSSRVDYALEEDRGVHGGSAVKAGSGCTFDAVRFPAFRSALASRRVVELGPGEALFVPALWFHHVAADAREGSGPSIAVNAFWRPARVPETESDPGDVFGNKDPPASRRAAELAARAGSALANLPEPHRTFYARRAIEAFAAQLGRRVEAESDKSDGEGGEV